MLTYLQNLNRRFLLSPKLLYLVINLQFYTLHQFRGNFATDFFKISKEAYGMMLGFLLFLTFFTNIGIATLNDKFNRQRFCLIGLLAVSCLFFQAFYVPTYIKSFAGMFWINLLLYLMFNTSIPPLLDKITLDYLGRLPNVGARTYGRQRMYGTLGYLLANYTIEKSITKPGSSSSSSAKKTKKEYNFDNLRYYQVITTLVACASAALLISPGNTAARQNDLMRSWKDLVRNRAYMFFILIILLNGITRAAMTMYLTIYLTDIVKLEGYSLPASWPGFVSGTVNLFNGNPLATTTFFGIFLEVVILYNSQSITGRFGLYWPLLFAQVFQLLRFACYFMLNHDSTHAFAYVCMFELMKGLNFGLTHTSAVQIATMLWPPHLKTTSQMIYSGTFTGLASVFAGLVFGSIFKKESMESKKADIGDKVRSFQMFYLVNVLFNVGAIVLFVYKYGFVDRILTLDPFMGRSIGEEDIDQSGKIKKKNQEDNNGENYNDNGEDYNDNHNDNNGEHNHNNDNHNNSDNNELDKERRAEEEVK